MRSLKPLFDARVLLVSSWTRLPGAMWVLTWRKLMDWLPGHDDDVARSWSITAPRDPGAGAPGATAGFPMKGWPGCGRLERKGRMAEATAGQGNEGDFFAREQLGSACPSKEP